VEVSRTRGTRQREHFTVEGHPLASAEDYLTSAEFFYRFEPFGFRVSSEDGDRKTWVEVAGAVLGSEAHPIRDRRYRKRFKGVFLAKDYFVIQNVNDQVFAGSGEWQNLHIIVNCQDLELSMNREGILETGVGSVYDDILTALREFANCLKRGKRFRHNGRLIEKGSAFAGNGYELLKRLKDREAALSLRADRALQLLALTADPRVRVGIPGFPLFPPRSNESLLALFQAFVTKGSAKDQLSPAMRRFRDLRILAVSNSPELSVLVQTRRENRWGGPLLYRLSLEPSDQDIERIKSEGADGVLCWKPKRDPSQTGLDVVELASSAQELASNHFPAQAQDK
jgi:hypothetical protein